MRTLFLIAAFAVLMNAQPTQKPAPEAPMVESAPSERALTEAEVLKIRATSAEIKALQQTYKIQEFNEKVQPKSTEQEGVYVAACRSIGIPEDKIRAECGIATGLDPDGNPMRGADGQPIKARVWWNRPTASDLAVTAKK